MGRPKGSRNKMTPYVVPAQKPVNKPVETVDKPKAIVPSGTFCKDCKHDQELHYGGDKGNCNRMNCPCLEYK